MGPERSRNSLTLENFILEILILGLSPTHVILWSMTDDLANVHTLAHFLIWNQILIPFITSRPKV